MKKLTNFQIETFGLWLLYAIWEISVSIWQRMKSVSFLDLIYF